MLMEIPQTERKTVNSKPSEKMKAPVKVNTCANIKCSIVVYLVLTLIFILYIISEPKIKSCKSILQSTHFIKM